MDQPAELGYQIAVVLPCRNEEHAIAQVLTDFKRDLPTASLYVFDNASTDRTASVAQAHGAQVVHVALPGKGHVVRRMLADVDADVYVMVDGDATYDTTHMAAHVEQLLTKRLDMLVGRREDDGSNAQTYRRGHRWGNQLLTGFVAHTFGNRFTDMLSGYRVFSRRFAKSFPAMSHGFEIETELTIHALQLRMPCAEVPVPYRARPEGSASKLSTYRDGWRILMTICRLFITERPLAFFSSAAALLAVASIVVALPLLFTYLHTGLVPRIPTALLSTGLMGAAMLSLVCGAVLHNVAIGRSEAKTLAYLAQRPPQSRP